jgi:hypothetical protein
MPAGSGVLREVRQTWTAYAVSQAGSGVGAGALPLVAILILDAWWQPVSPTLMKYPWMGLFAVDRPAPAPSGAPPWPGGVALCR